MNSRVSIIFCILFLICGMFYFSEDFFINYIGDIYAKYVFRILLLPFIVSIILGPMSASITASVKRRMGDKDDIAF